MGILQAVQACCKLTAGVGWRLELVCVKYVSRAPAAAPCQAKPSFFCKLLEVMTDDDIALCLSPQGFSNVDPATDIFNNTNQQFWE